MRLKHTFTDPIFANKINVFFGTKEELEKKYYIVSEGITPTCRAFVDHFIDKEKHVPYFFFWFRKDIVLSDVVHECSHMVDTVFDYVGMKKIDTEVRAYYLGFLFDCVYKIVKLEGLLGGKKK